MCRTVDRICGCNTINYNCLVCCYCLALVIYSLCLLSPMSKTINWEYRDISLNKILKWHNPEDNFKKFDKISNINFYASIWSKEIMRSITYRFLNFFNILNSFNFTIIFSELWMIWKIWLMLGMRNFIFLQFNTKCPNQELKNMQTI